MSIFVFILETLASPIQVDSRPLGGVADLDVASLWGSVTLALLVFGNLSVLLRHLGRFIPDFSKDWVRIRPRALALHVGLMVFFDIAMVFHARAASEQAPILIVAAALCVVLSAQGVLLMLWRTGGRARGAVLRVQETLTIVLVALLLVGHV